MADHRRAPIAGGWSELPQEIVSNIGKRLNSTIDEYHFRSVCKNWRSTRNANLITLLSPSLPCKISNDNLPFTVRRHDPLILFARAVFLVKPLCSSSDSCGWLLTVEEMVPGKLRILYPLSIDRRVEHLPSNFPKYLDLTEFRVTEVAKSYGFRYLNDGEDVAGVRKVILCSGSTPTAMVLYGKGTLVGIRLKNGNWGYVRNSLICLFKDVISFKGMIYSVDLHLNVLKIDYKTMNVVHSSHDKSTDRSTGSIRLVKSDTGLRLVEWYVSFSLRGGDKFQFVIYRWDEIKSKWDPEKCLRSSIIFVSLGWCFLADIPSISGECIVYSADCFASSASGCSIEHQLFGDSSMDLTVGVFFRINEKNSTLDSLWNHIADWLWPPPFWFLPEEYTFSGDDENGEELIIYNPDILFPFPEELLPRNSAVAPAIDVSNKQALVAKTVGMNVPTAAENSHALRIQSLNQTCSKVEFKGVGIMSNLVPTLQKVWAKHGNILEGSKICNSDMIARALESLATALIILETSSGLSLNKIQADYLSSVLCDLQHRNFKVEWLVPFVDNALAVYKSKPLIDSLKDFHRAKAQAEEMKLKVLDELAKLDDVEEDMVLASERLSVLESMDFDRCLGDGLY